MNIVSGLFIRFLCNRQLWFVVLGLASLTLLVRHAGWYVSGPVDIPTKTDLIVALGGGARARDVQASRLFTAGNAARVLLTGLENGAEQTRQPYLHWRAAFLLAQGMPCEAIYFGSQSHNTREEAWNTRLLMEKNGRRTVLVVSDPPHMRRLSWMWGKAFDGSPLQYHLISAPMPEWDAAHWWRHEVSAQFVLIELIKLGYYHAAY